MDKAPILTDEQVRKEILAEVQPIIDDLCMLMEHGDFRNGNEFQGSDEGEYQASRFLDHCKTNWNNLKSKYGIK